jgi:hypothetical protein
MKYYTICILVLLCNVCIAQQFIPAWTHTYNNSSSISKNLNLKVCFDKAFNFYILSREDTGNDERLAVKKMDKHGNEIFKKSFQCPGDMQSFRIVSDDSSNIYVASCLKLGKYSLLIQKLDSSGNLLWCDSINDAYYSVRSFTGMDFDSLNNIYLLGNTDSVLQYAALISKINPSGNIEWTVKHKSDRYYPAIHARQSGIYINRMSTPYLAIERFDALGNFISSDSIIYNGTNSNPITGDDKYGNMYLIFVNDSNNLNLFKWDTNGILIWQKTYQGNYAADKIAFTDNSFYIAGRYGSTNLLFCQRYDYNGIQIWSQYFSFNSFDSQVIGVNALNDQRVFLSINKSDTMESELNIVLDALGNRIAGDSISNYPREDRMVDVALTPDGDLLIVGHSKDNYQNRYSFAGFDTLLNRKFVKYESYVDNGFDRASVIKEDLTNNLILAGTTEDSVGNICVFLVKTDKSGNVIWKTVKSTPYNSNCGASVYDVKIDSQNNILIKGRNCGDFIYKFSSQGDSIYYKENFYQNVINDIAVAENGNYFICGMLQYSSPTTGYITKLDTAGQAILNIPIQLANTDVECMETYVRNGSLYLLYDNDLGSLYKQYFVRKYDLAGNLIWHFDISSCPHISGSTTVGKMEVNNDRIYFYGSTDRDTNTWYLAAIDTNGLFQWDYTKFSAQSWYGNDITDIDFDPSGNLFLTGYEEITPQSFRGHVIGLDVNGNETLDIPLNNFDGGQQIYYWRGNLIVCTHLYHPPGDSLLTTIIDTTGILYPLMSASIDNYVGYGVLVDSADDFYQLADIRNNYTYTDFYLLAYKTSLTSVSQVESERLIVYPNPASGVLKVNLQGLNASAIFVYDIFGRPVYEIDLHGTNESYSLDISQLPAGTYDITVIQGEKSSHKKFIKI